MEALWKAIGDGSKVLIDAVVASLVAIVSNPVFLFSLPAIYGAMYVFKQVTPFLKKSKWHNAVYTIMPLVFGVFYALTLKLFPGYFKLSLGYVQLTALGAGLGLVNVLAYKGITIWQKRNEKKEQVK